MGRTSPGGIESWRDGARAIQNRTVNLGEQVAPIVPWALDLSRAFYRYDHNCSSLLDRLLLCEYPSRLKLQMEAIAHMLIDPQPAQRGEQLAAPGPEGRQRHRRAVPYRSLLMVGATLALVVALALLPIDLSRLGAYGYLGVFLLALLASATVVLPSPALGVGIVAGKTLDPWLSGLLMGLGASLGEVTGYLAGRAGSELAARSQLYPLIARRVERYGAATIFILAAIPSPLLDLAGIAAGALRMPFWRFQLACAAGKIMRFMLVAQLGSYLAERGWI